VSLVEEKHLKTDILVIGGGMAGIFAAIKAREQGADVILVDKGVVGKTSGAHFAEGDLTYFRPERGHNLVQWLDEISLRCEYLNDRDWDCIVLEESKDRQSDLLAWGIPFYKENNEIPVDSMSVHFNTPPIADEYISMMPKKYSPALRKKAIEFGIKIMDRFMSCDLLKQNDRVVGAIGFHTTTGIIYVLSASAVIVATGGVGQHKASGSDIHFYTGDGEAMAYRAGAEITGKEFSFWGLSPREVIRQAEKKGKTPVDPNDVNDIMARFPFVSVQSGWPFPNVNAEGGPIVFPPWEIHNGRGPVYADIGSYPPEMKNWIARFFKRTGTAEVDKIGLDILKGGKLVVPAGRSGDQLFGGGCGIWPIDTNCGTDVQGLFAAGNCCATRGAGATYAAMGFGLVHAMVTGTRAATGASAYASGIHDIDLQRIELSAAVSAISSPVQRQGGFSPAWLTQVLQGLVTPYFVTQVKHHDRLEPALKLVKFVNCHLVPKLKARDPHEWRMAFETRNMVLNSQMVLEASLFRTESRGGHFREDFPRRDDPAWLAWIKIKQECGEMKVYKEPVPEKWWPDLTKPYEERYPNMLPLE